MAIKKNMKGFSLIEIIIIIGILSILAAISVPIYKGFVIQALDNSCLHEVKGYSNQVYTFLNDQDDDYILTSPVVSACASITDASQWLVSEGTIIARVKEPSTSQIECNISTGAPCRIVN